MSMMGQLIQRRMKPEQMGIAEFVARLFGSHDRQLHQHLYRMLRSRQAAEEVAQTTYLRLFSMYQPEDVKSPEALLFTMATRCAIDYLRAERRRREGLGQTSTLDSSEIDKVPDNAASPYKQVALGEVMKHFEQVVGELRPKHRTAFELRFVQQLSHHEIAARLNISADAAQQRVAAAINECRRKLEALGIDPRSLY